MSPRQLTFGRHCHHDFAPAVALHNGYAPVCETDAITVRNSFANMAVSCRRHNTQVTGSRPAISNPINASNAPVLAISCRFFFRRPSSYGLSGLAWDLGIVSAVLGQSHRHLFGAYIVDALYRFEAAHRFGSVRFGITRGRNDILWLRGGLALRTSGCAALIGSRDLARAEFPAQGLASIERHNLLAIRQG